MENPPWLEELRVELVGQGLPPEHIERIILELSDHLEDNLEERRLMDEKSLSAAIGQIGVPAQLARAAAAEYRGRTFFGCHPVLTFAVLPIFVVFGAWVAMLQAFVWGGLRFADVAWMTDSPAGLVGLRVVWSTVFQLPVVVAALLFYRVALASGRSWRWYMLSCLMLAVIAAGTVTIVEPPRDGMRGGLGVGFLPFFPLWYSWKSQIIVCAIPIAIGLWVGRRRRTLPLAPALLLAIGIGTWYGLFTQNAASAQSATGGTGAQELPKGTKPANPQEDRAKIDKERLQGVWKVVSMESGAKPSKSETALFMVDGKRACWQTSTGDIEGGLYVNPSTQPKTYDFVTSARTLEGIYSLEGDTLTLCYDYTYECERPCEFSTKNHNQRFLVVLKRIFGAEMFPFRRADGSRAFPRLIENLNEAKPRPTQVPETDGSPPARIGKITVIGNKKIALSVILKHVPLVLGEVLDYPSLLEPEKNLAATNLFVVDPSKGIRPTLRILDLDEDCPGTGYGPGPAFKEILITVQEK